MNLQTCIPYQPCPFHCPMCIAGNPNHFDNLYKTDRVRYFTALRNELAHGYNAIVLTGDTEPTLDKKWLREMINEVRANATAQIEIQTHNYNIADFDMLNDIDVVAYSITTPIELAIATAHKLPRFKALTRLVILGTKANADYIRKHGLPTGYEQITIKLLQHGNGEKENKAVDNMSATAQDFKGIKVPTECSFRLDINCQDSQHRYRVFRENGKTYKSW